MQHCWKIHEERCVDLRTWFVTGTSINTPKLILLVNANQTNCGLIHSLWWCQSPWHLYWQHMTLSQLGKTNWTLEAAFFALAHSGSCYWNVRSDAAFNAQNLFLESVSVLCAVLLQYYTINCNDYLMLVHLRVKN